MPDPRETVKENLSQEITLPSPQGKDKASPRSKRSRIRHPESLAPPPHKGEGTYIKTRIDACDSKFGDEHT